MIRQTVILSLTLVISLIFVNSISAQTGQAARYQPGDWVNYSNFHYVTSFEEGDRYVYIGTTHGVLRFNKTSERYEYPYTLSNGLQNDYVLNMVFLSDTDELWVFTRGGVDVIYTVLDRWEHIGGAEGILQQAGRGVRVGLSPSSVWLRVNQSETHEFSRNGQFYRGRGGAANSQVQWKSQNYTNDGLNQYFLGRQWSVNRLNNTLENENFREYQFTVRMRDTQNREWIGTWGAGFILADPVTMEGEVERFGPLSSAVGALFKKGNRFWFGSAAAWYVGPPSIEGEHGISSWNTGRYEWSHYTSAEEHDIEETSVYAITGDEERIWFGTDRGLLSYRPEEDQWYHPDHPSLGSNQIYDVEVTDTTLWVATRTGLYDVAHPSGYVRERLTLLENRFLSAYDLTIQGDSIFVGTDQGLVSVHRNTHAIRYYDDDGNNIPIDKFHGLRIYTLDSAGDKLYYANDFGVFELNLATKELTQLPKLGLLARSVVRVIQAGPENLWVGFDDGLGRYFIEPQEWRFYTTEDGLAANQIYDLVLTNGEIWCATRRGVTRFRIDKF